MPLKTVQHNHTCTEHLNTPLNVNFTDSETITNPTPINIQPHSDLNVIKEECTSTDFRIEIMSGVKRSRIQKLFICKVKLKKVISRIDKLTTCMSPYTLLEDDKVSEENLIFLNELKDTCEYLIQMGKEFFDRATALEIVTSPQSHFEVDQNISDDDDVIYISTANVQSESKSNDKQDVKSKIKEPIPIKKELAATRSSSSSSDNDIPDTNVTIPPFKHKQLIRKGGKFVCSQCKMDFGTKSELHNHFASHTNITFKCNICSNVLHLEQSNKNHCYSHFKDPSICLECNKLFPLKSSLSNHMWTHSGVEDVCPVDTCGKSFQSRVKYLEHVQYAHLQEKTVQCHMCSEFFQTPSNLHYHLSSVHLIFPKGTKTKV